MKIISSEEINTLYKKANLDPDKKYYVNTNFNKGTLNNKISGRNILNSKNIPYTNNGSFSNFK